MNLTESFPQSVKTVHGVKKSHLEGATALSIQAPKPRSQVSGFLKILWRLETLKVAFIFKVAMIQ